jgi:chromosome segregation ATPase
VRKDESGDWASSNDGSDGDDGDDAPFVPRSGESASDAKARKAKEARAKRMERKRKGTEPSEDKLTRLQKRKLKNRESAARSRNRKQQYTDDLEQVSTQCRESWYAAHCHTIAGRTRLTRRLRRRRRREQEVQRLTQENERLRKELGGSSKDVPEVMPQPVKAGPRLVSEAAAAASAAQALKRLARASSLTVGSTVLRRATTLPF